MAFGKKKGDHPTAASAAALEDDDEPLFPDEEPAAELGQAPAAEASAPAPTEAAAVEAPAPAPEAAVPSTDALLSAFQTNEGVTDDRSVLVDLAGDVELADLLDELNTLAAAIGITRA
jgi:hypothetical protein